MGYIREPTHDIFELTGRRRILRDTLSSSIPSRELYFRLTSYACSNRAHAKDVFDFRYPETPSVMAKRAWLVPAYSPAISTKINKKTGR